MDAMETLKLVRFSLLAQVCEVAMRVNCCAVDILFFLDESGSIAQADYLGLLQNISTFVGGLTISQTGIRVGIIEFSNFTNNTDYGNNVVNLFEYATAVELQQRIGTLGHSGGYTEIASAFKFAKNNYFANAANVRDTLHVFIYIGDGLFTGEPPFDALDVSSRQTFMKSHTLMANEM